MSIRFRIALVVTLIFVSVSAIGAGLSYWYIHTLLRQAALRQAIERAEALLENIETDPLLLPLPDEGEAIAVWLLNGESRELLFVSPPWRKIISPAGSYLNENPVVEASRGLEGEKSLVLRFAQTRTDLSDSLARIRFLLSAAILLSAGLSAYLSYLAGDVLLRPLHAITGAARRINLEGSLEPVEVPSTHDEVALLAQTFNEMLLRIGRTLEKQNHFFASASHELRTPLAIMQTQLEVKLRQTSLSVDMRELLTGQLEECKRLQRLVEDFLLVSVLKNPELPLYTAPLPLDELLLEVLDRFTLPLHERGLTLNLVIDSQGSYQVWGDRQKLFTVLSNLLDNALKYAPTADTIQLGLHTLPDTVRLRVSNRLDKILSHPERLTEAFYQTNPLENGFGMGLWIARKILEQHQAHLNLFVEKDLFVAEIDFKAKPI